MVLEPIYLDLSSSDDEEDHTMVQRSSGLDTLLKVSKVFGMDLDDDDVKIIERPMNTMIGKRDKGRIIRSAIDDDECCILDTDPAADATTDIVDSLDSDELVMTGEKGPVACRDFPHARYLCVHFPFKTSHHSKFCAQCHCYVCDTLAPCTQWGEGNLSSDHCHASDKEARWKTLRKITKCSSDPAPVTATAGIWTGATVVSQVASTFTNKSGSKNRDRVSNGVQSSLSRSLDSTTSINQPSVGTPVGSGVFRQVHAAVTTTKRDPLVIKLKGKGRGKPSQLHHHLGVRTSHSQRILPQSSFPVHKSLGLPRSTSAPSGREGILPTALHPSQSTLNPNAVPYVPATIPPPPSAPPPAIPPPPPVEFDHLMQPAGGNAIAGGFIPTVPHISDSRYVPASAFSDQQACYMNMASPYGDRIQPYPIPEPNMRMGSEYISQEYRNHLDQPHYASSSFITSNGGAVDILAGPTEGWVVDAPAPFEEFPNGISTVADPGDGQQAAASLDDVLEHMASEDFLWEQFPIFSNQF